MFERIRKWYMQGLWTAAQVQQSIQKGVLSDEEATQIIKEEA